MKTMVCCSFIAVAMIVTSVTFAGPLGNFSCKPQSTVKVFVGDNVYSARREEENNNGIKNKKQLKLKKDCFYGEVDAGTDPSLTTAKSGKCVFAFIKQSEEIHGKGKTSDQYTAAQCVFHKAPDKLIKVFQGMEKYTQVMRPGSYYGNFDDLLKDHDGVAICLDAIKNSSLDGYGDKSYCEFLSGTRDANGKKNRIAGVDFNMTPGGAAAGAAAAATGEGKAAGGDKNPVKDLKKKFGF
jgi:hypothetical protein